MVTGGGVLILSALLSFSVLFASCADNVAPDDKNPIENPNQNTPENSNQDGSEKPNENQGQDNSEKPNDNQNQDNSENSNENAGENPIKKTISLKSEGSSNYLELKADGTALFGYNSNNVERTQIEFRYAYDEDAKTIRMKVEKFYYPVENENENENEPLLTYDEMLSKFDKYYTVEKSKQTLKKSYEELKTSFKENFENYYPNCETYEDYEKFILKVAGFENFADYVEFAKTNVKNQVKAIFSAQTTFDYKIQDGKMTLTEKFTGVKNLLNSSCAFNDNDDRVYISVAGSMISLINGENNLYYSGILLDTDKKKITLQGRDPTKPEEEYKKEEATYVENLSENTVTVTFKGKEYVCAFKGQNFVEKE